MAAKDACAVCGEDGEEWVLVKALHQGEERVFCMRCFHPLMHGMSPEELKRRQNMKPA